MKERPMIFNAEMVRAILDGRKTQTRRIMKKQPEPSKAREGDFYFPCDKMQSMVHVSDFIPGNSMIPDAHEFFSKCCPFGEVGDRIWVRETWTPASVDAEEGHYAPDYRATENGQPVDGRWRPSIHMPRWASRITLEITGVRVERLNSISQEDAQAEGMKLTGWRPTYSDPDSGGEVWTPYDNFAQLWESIYGEESWQANPWVWAITFRHIEGGAA